MFYRKSEEKYWGIIRRPRDHPQHQATFATRIFLPQQVEQRRVGRPRAAWTYETMKDCWRRKFHNIPFQIQNREHREQIKTWALNREGPFWQFFLISPLGRTAAVVVPTGLTQTYGFEKKHSPNVSRQMGSVARTKAIEVFFSPEKLALAQWLREVLTKLSHTSHALMARVA